MTAQIAIHIEARVAALTSMGQAAETASDPTAWLSWAFVVVTAALIAVTLHAFRLMAAQRRLQNERDSAVRRRDALAAQLHASSTAVFMLRSDGQIDELTPAAAELLGMPAEQLTGQSLYDFAEPAHRDEFRSVITALAAGDRVGRIETVWQSASGRSIDVALTFTVSETAIESDRDEAIASDERSGPTIMLLAHDISSHHEHELVLRQTRDLLSAVLDASAAGIMAF
ncbi:MAG: PAS domain-containing protein, partial [Planctomycetota bacterium]